MPDVDDADRGKILENLRAHQRAFLAGRRNADTGLILLDGGFDAARKIVALDPADFVEASGLPPEEAVAVHYAAKKASTDAAVKSIAIRQLEHAHAPPAVETPENVRELFADIPGYSTLFPDDFGFCDCDECCSVLGLPAYFVDLMFFVDQHILDNVPSGDPIHLRARREDLWTLDLTCQNANEVVAYLDIVVEILERYVAKKLGLAHVADVWARIAQKNPSFFLPMNLPLARIGRISVTSASAASMPPRPAVRTKPSAPTAQLGVSGGRGRPDHDASGRQPLGAHGCRADVPQQLYPHLEVYPNGTVETTGFPIVFVSNILEATGASREELGKLLATTFVGGTAKPAIRAGRQSAQSIQNDTEVIEKLKAEHLDRLHRFYRLSRDVPWTILELDRTLSRLATEHVSSGLDDRALLRIARLLEHQERLGLSVEELTGLWTQLPNDPLDGKPGFFDSLFNPPQLASLGSPIPYTDTPTGSFQHPSFNTTGTSVPQDQNTLARLLAGLRISDVELVQLLLQLALPLGLGAGNKLALSIHNLTLLYRHATLARCLSLTVAGLFQLLEIAELPLQTTAGGQKYRVVGDWSLTGATPSLVDDLGIVLGAHDWTAESPFTTDQIAFISGGAVVDQAKLVESEKRADTAAVVDAIVTQLLADRAFEFADTVLSGMPNGTGKTLTEDESREIVRVNSTLFETPPGRATLRLKKEISAADITFPAPTTRFAVTAAQVAAELTKRSIHTLIVPSLAKALGFSPEKTTELLRLSGQNGTLTSTGFRTRFAALIYGSSTDRKAILVDLVEALAPFAVLYRDDLYDEQTLGAIYPDRAKYAVDVLPDRPEGRATCGALQSARHRDQTRPTRRPRRLPTSTQC